MTSYRNILLVGAVLFGIAGISGHITIVRDLALRRARNRLGTGLPGDRVCIDNRRNFHR